MIRYSPATMKVTENPNASNSALDALINENHMETEEEQSNTGRMIKKQQKAVASDPNFDIRLFGQKDIEREFDILGVTAMEDLLQDNVKTCISDFREAGIKVWMLTGDKGDTAHQIAFSCGLYSHEQDFKVFRIEEDLSGDGKNTENVINQMNGLKDEAKYGVTISATTLVKIMAGEDG